jgi:hypothetical protein
MRTLSSIIFLLALLLPVSAGGQEEASGNPGGLLIRSEDSFLEPLQKRDSVLVADQFRYGFHLKNVQEGTRFAFPDFSKGFMEGVEIVSSWRLDTVKVQGDRRGPKTYDIDASLIITSFDAGKYDLLPLSVVRASGADRVDTLLFDSQPLDVRVMPVDTATYQLHDLKGQIRYPLTFRELLPYLLAFWGVVVLGILVWVLIRSGRKRKQVAARQEPPHLVALRKLDRFRGNKFWAPEKQKQFYSGITDALREYIDARFGIDAREMTTAEIFEDIRKVDLSSDLYQEMKTLFETADLVKFAKAFATDAENSAALPIAVRFVTTTYQSQLAEEKENEGGTA